MTSRHEVPREVRRRSGWTASGWFLGIIGGIAAFLGLFVLFAGDDQSIGLGGDLSWQVSEVSTAWTYGLLIGGGLLLLAALVMVMFGGRDEAAPSHASDLTELLWHAGIFVVVNAFIWAQDIAIGGGVEYAYWVTIPWGIGLAIHAVTFYWTGRETEPRHLGRPQPH